jgi:hypothetical protein
MTREEIEVYQRRLINVQRIKDRDKRKEATVELGKEVGASYCAGEPDSMAAMNAENIAAIHQALQTASMIDACRTAAENARLTHDALGETRKAQRTSRIIAIAAGVSALAAVASAIAAWAAALGP